MKTKAVLKRIWIILKPILSLGLSVLISHVAKKSGEGKEIIETTGNTVKDNVFDTVDDLLEDEKLQAPKN